MSYIDIPKYRVSPRPERFLVNQIFVEILLGVLLYLGIFVNYFLINESIPEFLNGIFIVGILLTLIIDALLSYMKYGHYVYEFHENRLVVTESDIKTVPYDSIKTMHYTHNLLDDWFKTGSIVLNLNDGKKIKIRYLYNSNQVFFWLQKNLRH
jgi:hypothetical protein